jgi:hypothetical protein
MSTPSAHFIKGRRTRDQIDIREMVLPLVVIDVHEAVARNPDSPGRAARGPDNGREQGQVSRGLSARLAAIETGPAAPNRPQPGTTNPSHEPF